MVKINSVTLTTTLLRSSVLRDMLVLHKLPVAWMCNLLSFKFENISSARQLLRYYDRAWFKVLRQSALFIVSCNFFISFYATSSFGINKTREKIDRGTWFQTWMYTYTYIIPTATVRVTCIIYLSANNCITVSFLPLFFEYRKCRILSHKLILA